VSLAATALVAGCSSSDGDYRSDQRTVTINPNGPERRADVVVAAPDTHARETPRSDGAVGDVLNPAPVGNIPAQVHAAAMKEVPGGDVVSAEQYAAGDVDVYDLRITASDGPHEVKVRNDGVVLLHRREIATEVAGVTSDESARIASRP
jgi:uncharacterized membrane protein YkoI